jgi:two-component system response regulator
MEEKLDSFDILLIEDNDEDAELTLRVFRSTGLVNNALHFQTAEMALSYLRNAEHLPKIALIDLNLPGGMSGLEFLRQLKNEEKTRQIRTAFLTGFVEQQFIDTFIIGTSSFFLKPLDPYKLAEIVAEVPEN